MAERKPVTLNVGDLVMGVQDMGLPGEHDVLGMILRTYQPEFLGESYWEIEWYPSDGKSYTSSLLLGNALYYRKNYLAHYDRLRNRRFNIGSLSGDNS